MSKPPNYRVDQARRTLQIALVALERGNSKPFITYLRDGGTIIEKHDRDALADALADALTPTKRKPGKPSSMSDAAAAVLARERQWRKKHPGKRLPRGYRDTQIERTAQAAWREEGQFTLRKGANIDTAHFEFVNAVTDEILNALENKRKNRSRKPRI